MLVIRYDDARSAVIEHLRSNGTVKGGLNNAIVALQRKASGEGMTDYKKQNCKLSTEAIEAFQISEKKLGIGRVKFKAPNLGTTKLRIGGVSLSISIDLVTQKIGTDGKKTIGGIILVFSKSGSAKNDLARRCPTIAMPVFQLIKQDLEPGDICDPKMFQRQSLSSKKPAENALQRCGNVMRRGGNYVANDQAPGQLRSTNS